MVGWISSKYESGVKEMDTQNSVDIKHYPFDINQKVIDVSLFIADYIYIYNISQDLVFLV